MKKPYKSKEKYHLGKVKLYQVLLNNYKYINPQYAFHCYQKYLYHANWYEFYMKKAFDYYYQSDQVILDNELINKVSNEFMPNQIWKTNWDVHAVPLEELIMVKSKDDIPSINKPKFESINNAKKWLADKEPVIFVKINDQARAYPLQILMWHEIVNDSINDKPIAVTYCPLCNSAFTFNRMINGITYEFGVSGLLRNSNLVMYDRKTESLWQQFIGTAIVGDLTGKKLTFIPSSIVSFSDFYKTYPDGVVLSKNTGYNRDYGENPYLNYDDIDNVPFLFKGEIDERLPAMERVVGVWDKNISRAYSYNTLSQKSVMEYQLGNQDIVIFYQKGTNTALGDPIISESRDVGATGVFSPMVGVQKLNFYTTKNNEILDRETESKWNVLGKAISGPLSGKQLPLLVHGDPFWFAWASFYPNTEII